MAVGLRSAVQGTCLPGGVEPRKEFKASGQGSVWSLETASARAQAAMFTPEGNDAALPMMFMLWLQSSSKGMVL